MSEYRKYFTVSYDDGLQQDKATLEMMRKYGIRGTFNLNSGLFGQESRIKYLGRYGLGNVEKAAKRRGLWRYADADRIPADEIRQVYAGMEIASHSVHHADLSKLSPEQLDAELLQDREILRQFTDLPVVGHAFPFGRTSETVERMLRANGFLYGRGVTSEKAKRGFRFPENPFCFSPTCWQIESDLEKLADQFIAAEPTDGDLLFCMWGHGYEFDFVSLKGLRTTCERIFDKIASHSGIIRCTNAEAFLSQKK